MSIIDRLLDEAEKAQRKGHLLLAEVCRNAADELGLVIEERNQLRKAVAVANSVCGKNNCNCPTASCAIDDAIPRMPVDRVGGW
jgi:hypothetical protein